MLGAVLLATLLAAPAPRAAPRSVTGQVVYVVDGDTIHVQLGQRVEKVRYIGVNAAEIPHPRHGAGGERRAQGYFPHTVAAGEAARRINLDLVGGKAVRLEFDRRRRDDYKRLLAYVWVGDLMVNAELVRRGYAEVMSVPPDFRHRALFVRLQDEARAAGRGLWQSSPPAWLPAPPAPRRAPAAPRPPR
jgi:micrococcal nuclease